MYSPFKRWTMAALRIPPQPHDPAGADGTLRVFRAAPNYFKYALFRWFLRQRGGVGGGGFLLGGLGGLRAAGLDGVGDYLILASEAFGICAVLGQALFSLLLVRLDYELRWYKLTDRSLRIREGVWNVREMTLTLANIQNISVSRGPVQRLLGIADVKVQTAGGGAGAAAGDKGHQGVISMHEGVFRGVDQPEEIRDLLHDYLKRFRDAGLGDTDEIPDAAQAAGDAPAPALGLHEALTQLRTEAAALRNAAQGARSR